MNKKIKIGLFVLLIIGCIILRLTYKNKNEVTKTKRKKQNNLAIIISDGNGAETTTNEIPKGNYTLNEEKTHCENNGKVLSYDSNTGKVKFSFIGSDRCYLYFDYDEKPTINNASVNNKVLKATLSDDKGLYGYQITSSNKTPKAWNEINGKTYNLSYTLTEPGRYYLWVKDSSGNVSNSFGKTGITMSLKNYIVNKYTKENLIKERTDLTKVYDETNDYLFKTTSSQSDSTLYYYAGNTQNNWVTFGKYANPWYGCLDQDGTTMSYGNAKCTSNQKTVFSIPPDRFMSWRIIRTNENDGLQLLYSGTDNARIDNYIGSSIYNPYMAQKMCNNSQLYLNGLYPYPQNFYPEESSLNCEIYDINPNIKINNSYFNHPYNIINTWVDITLPNHTKYLSKTNNFCINESSPLQVNNPITFSSYDMFEENKYNRQIKYSDCSKTETHVSFGLMTADELVFAGGLPLKKTQNIWYNLNGSNQSYRSLWWSMSPAVFDGVETHIFLVNGQTFEFGRQSTNLEAHIRPVISLDSCVNFLSGDGSPEAPYIIDSDSCS